MWGGVVRIRKVVICFRRRPITVEETANQKHCDRDRRRSPKMREAHHRDREPMRSLVAGRKTNVRLEVLGAGATGLTSAAAGLKRGGRVMPLRDRVSAGHANLGSIYK